MASLAVQAGVFPREIPDVVDALCQLATLADVTGDLWRRDVSIEAAAYLIGQNGGVSSSDDSS